MIIPKSLKRQKLRIAGKITIPDIGLIIIYLLIAFGIGYGLEKLGAIIQIIVGLIVFLTFGLTLIYLPKQNLKIYEYIIILLVHLSRKNKYDKNDFQPFFNYKKIEDDCLVSQNLKIKIYTRAIEIQGLNINFLTPEEQALKIQILQDALTSFDFSFSILKINQPINLTNQIQKYEDAQDKIKKMYLSKQLTELEMQTRLIELKNTMHFFNSENEHLEEDLGTKYILFIYANSAHACNTFINVVISKMVDLRLDAQALDIKKTLYYCKAILDPYDTPPITDTELEEIKDNLSVFFKLDELKIQPDMIKTKDMNYHISLIYDYPNQPMRMWLNNLFAYPNTCIIHSKFLTRAQQKRIFERSLANSQANLYSQRKTMDLKEFNQISEGIDLLSDNIVAGIDNIRETKILFINYDIPVPNENKMKLIKNEFSRFVSDNLCSLNELNYRQSDALKCCNFSDTAIFNKLSYEIPNSAIAYGFPFTVSSLRDKSGLYLGNNQNGSIVVLDMFLISNQRKNHNAFILGQPGSGKSYTTKKMLYDMIISGYKCIVLDPEREYKQLCLNFGGQWIDAGNGINSKINPLQILPTISDEENMVQSTEIQIQNHLLFLENWFLTLLPELNYERKSLNYIIKIINELYKERKIYDIKNLEIIKPIDYPIFTDLLNYLKNHPNYKYSPQNFNYEMHVNWVDTIESDFINGKFSVLYNGHSQLTLNARKFIVLDLYTLLDKGVKNVIQAQLYLLLSFIQQEIKANRQHNQLHPEDKNKLFVVVDEAHTIIDKENLNGLNFLYQTVKRIRKYDGGIMLISQNPADFVGTPEIANKTQAIIANTQYNFIFNLQPVNVDDVNTMYHAMGGLTTNERNYILRAQKGQALLIINQLNRHLVQVNVEEYEAKNFS